MSNWNPYLLVSLVALATLVAHGTIIVIRFIVAKAFSGDSGTAYKVRTAASLIASTAKFLIYFVALGYILAQFGISLTHYLASASILALAVAFGSQGFVQDVVTGLTILIADIFNVGEMLEVAGQVGVVEEFGMRFTVLRNANGALIYVSNRNIATVIKYPRRHVRCHVDIVLPRDTELATRITGSAEESSKSLVEQFPALFLRATSFARKEIKSNGRSIFRITFRIWPGRGGAIESAFRQELLEKFKEIDETFSDWMVVVNYEVEVRNTRADPLQRARQLLDFRNAADQSR